MGLKVYNTLTRQKEEFVPVTAGKVGIYLCGPTVYKKSHIGHGVGPVIFDAMRRWLTAAHKYDVTLVLNVTDVDDKLITVANERNCTMAQVAEEVLADYRTSLDAMNVLPPTMMPKATAYIEKIIAMVETLIAKGYAYPMGGDVYYDVTKFADYGKLSGRKLEDQQELTRELQSSEGKRHNGDFALWKAAKPGEPAWASPWGKGRPGWHIECSAMSKDCLGETFDIHGGGMDLIFPHHENEIAQSEACNGKLFVKYWMHNGLTRVDTKKMSKSLGNVRSLEDLLKQWPGEVLRFFILSTHYRRPIDFSDEQITKVAKGMQTFYRLFDRVKDITGVDPYDAACDGAVPAALAEGVKAFAESMDDDFNTAGAIAALYDMAGVVNRFADEQKITSASSAELKNQLSALAAAFSAQARLIGLFLKRQESAALSDELTGGLIQLLIDVRAAAKKEKQFALSDLIRDRLAAMKIQLKDGRDGTTWEKV